MSGLSYQQLDFIADLYVPILFFITIFHSFFAFNDDKYSTKTGCVSLLILLLCVAYFGMFFDNYFQVWALINADYSTHTAVATVLVLFLFFTKIKYIKLVIVSLAIYFVLMLYQEYHTLLDIVSTLFYVIPVSFLMRRINSTLPFCRV